MSISGLLPSWAAALGFVRGRLTCSGGRERAPLMHPHARSRQSKGARGRGRLAERAVVSSVGGRRERG